MPLNGSKTLPALPPAAHEAFTSFSDPTGERRPHGFIGGERNGLDSAVPTVAEAPRSSRIQKNAFVGRARELQSFVDTLATLRDGRGSLFLLSGEPGIGKTRLAEEVAWRAERSGMTVVWGSAWDGGGAPAYWPWIQALRSLRGIVPEPGAGLRRDLGALWTADGESRDDDVVDREFRRYDALRAVLATAAERTPLVVVLDDLHAADRGTLTALHFVSRALRTLPILVLGTHRDAEVRKRPELDGLIERIARQGSRIELSRLRREDIADLTAELEPVPPASIDRIYEVSGGNPFFATELLRLVRSGAGKRIPDAVRAAVSERLNAIEPVTLETLEAMAVAGREASLEVLAGICDLPRPALVDTLASAVLAGILERPEAERYLFSHPLFRECLHEGLVGVRRSNLHRRAADVLSRLPLAPPGNAESIARHLLLALPEGDVVTAVERARSAAKGCVVELGFDRAVELLRSALSALGDSPDDALRSDIELELAEALVLVGQGEQSRKICASVAARARTRADAARLSRAALVYGTEIRVAVVDRLQLELLESALELLGDADPGTKAKVLARLAAARQPNADPQSPIAQAFEAIALARSTNDPDALLHALHTGGAALTGYAAPSRRRDVSSELAVLATERRDLVRAQRGYARWAIDAAELGDAAELAQAIRAEERLGRTLGHARFRWQSGLLGSMHALIEGRWGDSEHFIAEAERNVAELDDRMAENTLALHRLCARRARMSSLEVPPEDEFTVGSEGEGELDRAMRALGNASMLARMGEPDAARRTFERALPLPDFLPVIPTALALALEVAARVGHVDEARRLLPYLEALPFPALTWGATAFVWDGFLSDLVGRSHAVLENWDAAVLALESAIDAAESFGARPAALDSRLALASALLGRQAAGDAARAIALLELAESAARELDMRGPLRRAETLRREWGDPRRRTLTSRSESPSPPFTLQREGEVWCVTAETRTARFKHSRGLEILKELVDHPGRDFHVLDFVTKADPEALHDVGDPGEHLDGAAVLAYRKRSQELRTELEEAQRWNDAARCDRVRAELDFLGDELARGVGTGGKRRRASGAAERARVNVHKRLRGAIERLSSELPELGTHLEASIKTGFSVVYRPR